MFSGINWLILIKNGLNFSKIDLFSTRTKKIFDQEYQRFYKITNVLSVFISGFHFLTLFWYFWQKWTVFDYFGISWVTHLVWVLHKANRLLVYCWVHLSSARYIPHRQGFSYNSIPVRFDIWNIQSGLDSQYSRGDGATLAQNRSGMHTPEPVRPWTKWSVVGSEKFRIQAPHRNRPETRILLGPSRTKSTVRRPLDYMRYVTFLGHDHWAFLHTFYRRLPISLSG